MLTMKKLLILATFFLVPAQCFAAGLVPSVNADMGCTIAGQVVQYNGSTLTVGGGAVSIGVTCNGTNWIVQ
jgi:hypothetical protein